MRPASRILVLAGAALLLAPSLLSGQEEKQPATRPASLPSTEHHRFNTKVPESFDGEMKTLETPGGKSFRIYVSGPSDASAQVLLIHEWWGLNAHIKGLADQFGKLGYRAFAVDLYDGRVAETPEKARELMQEAQGRGKQLQAVLDAAVAHASTARPGARLGTIGWCFGGGWSLQTALSNPDDVDACVIYYGRLVTEPEKLAPLKAPVLGIFAERDTWITPRQVRDFEKAMKTAGKTLQVESYPADHAFANPSQTRFHEKSARKAWRHTLRFLKKHLRPGNPDKK